MYNVGGGIKNSLSIIELIEILEKKLNKKNKYEKFHWRSGDQKIYISNISKIKREYNRSQKIRISVGLDKVIRWISENDTNIKKILKI